MDMIRYWQLSGVALAMTLVPGLANAHFRLPGAGLVD